MPFSARIRLGLKLIQKLKYISIFTSVYFRSFSPNFSYDISYKANRHEDLNEYNENGVKSLSSNITQGDLEFIAKSPENFCQSVLSNWGRDDGKFALVAKQNVPIICG